MGLSFDGNITLGNVIEILVLAGGWVITITSINWRLKVVETNQEKHDAKLENLTKLSDMQARFDERMASVRRDIEEMKHGRGFVRKSIEGEYSREGKA